MKFLKILIIIAFLPLISSCSQIELASHLGKKVTSGNTPKSKGYYKIGSPYTIKGRRYYPSIDYNYDKRGIASWYGPGFHGKMTANGEIYNQNELTAAHKTLPLPSIVRVTNLSNGRSIVVRVNDRGPYARGRIIDMSQRSAELLGFKNKGVTKVRVTVLEPESKMVANVARDGGDTSGMEIAMNKPSYRSPSGVDLASANPKDLKHVNMTVKNNQTIPGHISQGQFFPDPIITEFPVTQHRVFVQVGSFSSRDNAMKYSSSLDKFGRAQIHPIEVDGKTYFRVRFPTQNTNTADLLLNRIIGGGHDNALIVVD